ncbi:MAG: LamG domain-containing protein, partial [Patescibacteria group bacterium]
CYDPSSKVENTDAESRYTKFGVNQPGCPGQSDDVECYWCRPLVNTPSCNLDGSPTPIPTANPSLPVVIPTSTPIPPTATPTPIVNPWGQAAVFSGKVAGRNPPSYTPIPEYVKVNYTSVMDIPSPNLTVEAWIKPQVPTAAGYHYRIVDSTYRLTMDARPNGSNVSYLYYFDVQSSNNNCGQTVVYSGGGNGYDPNNLNWFNESHYRTVSPSVFTTWRHIAGVLQNGNLHIYENGVKLNSYNISMTVCNDGRSIHVGAGLFGKNPPYYDYFQGAIDEVRVSKSARYTANFTPQNLPFTTDSQTLLLYHFDSNTTDSSSNNLNGQITGTVDYEESTIPY